MSDKLKISMLFCEIESLKRAEKWREIEQTAHTIIELIGNDYCPELECAVKVI
jgi:hypothetical protein